MSIGRRKSRAQIQADAWVWLGITPQELQPWDWISGLFRSVGGLQAVLYYLRGAAAPEARAVLELWDGTPTTYRRVLPFEAFCVAVQVPTPKMLGIIAGAMFAQGGPVAELLFAVSHEADVLDATIKRARRPSGTRERRRLLRHSLVGGQHTDGYMKTGSKR